MAAARALFACDSEIAFWDLVCEALLWAWLSWSWACRRASLAAAFVSAVGALLSAVSLDWAATRFAWAMTSWSFALVGSATASTSPAFTMSPTLTATLVTGQLGADALLFALDDVVDEPAGCEAAPNRRSYVVAADTLPLATTFWVTSRRAAAAVMYWPPVVALDGGRTPVATRIAPTPTARSRTTNSTRRDLIQGPHTTATVRAASQDPR